MFKKFRNVFSSNSSMPQGGNPLPLNTPLPKGGNPPYVSNKSIIDMFNIFD